MSETSHLHTEGSSATPPDPDRTPVLVGWTRDRTILAAGEHLHKVYERGTQQEAEAEARCGDLLRLPGMVKYHEARRDARTGRACVVMDYHPGRTIAQRLGSHGPFAPAAAIRIAIAITEAVGRAHDQQLAEAPAGVVHRDIKPANVQLLGDDPDPATAEVMILDHEHAIAAGATTGVRDASGFTGGTHGYAPPEAYAGTPPTPAFDIFGIGATLATMLAGTPPFLAGAGDDLERRVRSGQRPAWLLWGQHPELVAIVDRCLAQDPIERPAAGELKALLETAATRVEPELDGMLGAILRGDLDPARAQLERIPEDSPRRSELRRLLDRRARMRARCPAPALPADADELVATANAVATAAPRILAWHRRFPGSRDALSACEELHRRRDQLLDDAPQHINQLKHDGEFGRAQQLLDDTMATAHAAASLTITLSPEQLPDHPPGPMHRDPIRYLALAQRDLNESADEYQTHMGELRAAESHLDLGAAEKVLNSVSKRYGGASTIAARLKDRIHRLGFYLERAAQPTPALNEVREQLVIADAKIDLDPVAEFQQLCAENSAEHRSDSSAPRRNNLRLLQRVIHDLLTEFPHCREIAADSAIALDQAMGELTETCWKLLADARVKLGSEPIPVRPLLAIVNRIDTLRRLETLIDLPDRTRADLIDEHERLRIQVDQARTARDRLTRGAEKAMEEGHWTTALYDMERAVDRFSHDTGEVDQSGQTLVEQLEKARKQKQALNDAATENMQLAAKFADLQEDPASDHVSRVALLERRRKVLGLLATNLPEERAEPYKADLDDVELALAQERADHAETVFDAAVDGEERARISRETLAWLRPEVERGSRSGRRLQRVLERWERRDERLREARDAGRREFETTQEVRRRLLMGTGALLLVTVVAIAYGAGWLQSDGRWDALAASLDQELQDDFVLRSTPAGPAFDSAEAYSALRRFSLHLRSIAVEDASPASHLLDRSNAVTVAVRGIVNRGPNFTLDSWAERFGDAVADFTKRRSEFLAAAKASSTTSRLARHFERFESRAIDAGLFSAVASMDSDADHATIRALIERLDQLDGVSVSQRTRDAVEAQLR